jgi:hypothetical protein
VTLSSTEILGWTATLVFVGSYFLGQPTRLRYAQMAGASLWIGYGCLIHAWPVIIANVLVLSAATWTALNAR